MNYYRAIPKSSGFPKLPIAILLFSLASMTYAVNPLTISTPGLLHEQWYSGTTDTMSFASVVIYRPDNQLSRPYKMRSNLGEMHRIGRKEVIKMTANTNVFHGNISAFGHNRGHFSHKLTPNKVHYFRLQDRNNYAGLFPYLEVIEVTEETFRNETLGSAMK